MAPATARVAPGLHKWHEGVTDLTARRSGGRGRRPICTEVNGERRRWPRCAMQPRETRTDRASPNGLIFYSLVLAEAREISRNMALRLEDLRRRFPSDAALNPS